MNGYSFRFLASKRPQADKEGNGSKKSLYYADVLLYQTFALIE
ncbi:hypothetical protein B8V81_2427 [Paenibacillus pasadenensis]|uniref:Uncharacterized protein n=1 Tax=Paenibacillus pasadenensis TaxID=217090 RepID=A0A2N5N0Z1_9BACL|nr:hypothetical protein B8V81_2427 [Paenibacillus pasadenensis]